MSIIYHISNAATWSNSQAQGFHTAPSLESEGFIHLSKKEQVLRVANRIYTGQTGLILLCVDTEKVQAELKYEAPVHPDPNKPVPVSEDELFPHIYGKLNLEAVVRIVNFPCESDGSFRLPATL